jgi:hypothetical protein
LIPVLRLFVGIPVPKINRRTVINRANGTGGTGALHGTALGRALRRSGSGFAIPPRDHGTR